MDRPNKSLREVMKTLTCEEMQGAEHPSTESLLAYHRGEISPGEAALVREHLSLCPECSTALLDAADFFSDDDEEEETGAPELETSWEKLREAMGKAGERSPSQAPILAPLPPSRRSFVRSLPFAYGLAAIFAALSISLIFLRGPAPPPQPEVNVGLYDLTSAGAERGEGGEAREARSIRFRSPGDSVLLILNPTMASHFARHGVRIRRADGTVAWRSEDLTPQESGGFHLGLPAGALSAGRYAVELYGIGEGGETPLGTYPILVEK